MAFSTPLHKLVLIVATTGMIAFFGIAGSSFAQEPDIDVEDASPLVEQLRIKAGYGGVRLAEAISSFARIGNWVDVNSLLGQIDDSAADDELLAEMSKQIEPALAMRIVRSEQIDDKARSGLKKLREAERKITQSDSQLAFAIDQLDDASIDNQIAAARTLLGGGNAAIEQLVNRAVLESTPASRDLILRTMLRLGDDGVRGLRQLAIYGKPAVRLGALQSLVRIDKNASVGLLLSTLYWADATAAEVDFARKTLEQAASSIPNRDDSIRFLSRELAEKQRVAAQVDNDLNSRTMWFVNTQAEGVNFQTARYMTAVYRDAVDTGSLLRRFGSLPSDVAADAIIATLNYDVMLDLDWGDEQQIVAFRSSHAGLLEQTNLVDILSTAIELGSEPAAIALLRMIGLETDPALQTDWLTSASPLPSPLVNAAMSASIRVRYEAVSAIASFGTANDYPGSSFVAQTLSEMASLDPQPTAILVETRPDVIVAQETILSRLGYVVRVTSSVADAENAVDRGGDLRLLVAKTQLSDATPMELTDRVRRTLRGEKLPIVFYGNHGGVQDAPRWDAPLIYMDSPPRSEAALFQLFDELKRRRRLPEMTPFDRQVYREKAKTRLQAAAERR